MKIKQIQPWINKEEASYIKKIVQKKYLTEDKETSKFEKFFEKKLNINYSIAISNWTCGIYACLKVLEIGENDEVIVPNLTFVATINAVIMAGATPVICDVEPDNLCINVDQVSKYITKKTKAIIPVHLYGHCCDMSKLLQISKKKNIYIIEDAAQAICSTYKKRYLGTIGSLGGFSFYGNKIITTGEGGIILTKSKNLRDKIYRFKNHGRIKKGIFEHDEIGYNFMFTELQAAIGNIQIKKLNKILNKKKKIFQKYKKELSSLPSIKFMKNLPENEPVHWFTNIFLKEKKKLKNYLNKKNIQTRDIFLPINLQPCYNKKKILKNINNKFPVSQKIYDTGISLPSSYELKNKEQDYIIDAIKKFFN